jgi:hypothetical protein
LEFELGAGFEGACGFVLVLALSQIMEHGIGSLEFNDVAVIHEQVGIVIPDERPLLVI